MTLTGRRLCCHQVRPLTAAVLLLLLLLLLLLQTAHCWWLC
jgi:hypothetical protein